MEQTRTRPRISRETRLLLITALAAVAVLWVLARLRFPDSPVTANPVPPVLTQLATAPRFDDLAAEVSQAQARLQASLQVLNVAPGAGRGPAARAVALRVGDGVSAAWFPPESPPNSLTDVEIVGHDAASGLAVVLRPGEGDAPMPVPWVPRRLDQPRYLIASDLTQNAVTLRPVFIGALVAVENPAWPAAVWQLPAQTDVAPGSFVFNTNGELAGLVVEHAGNHAIVPAGSLLTQVNRLLDSGRRPAGDVGIQVRPLTADLRRATGASGGVVIVQVKEDSAAEGTLMVGDVVEALEGQPVATPQHWDARIRRLSAGDILSLRVRRGGEVRDVQLTAQAPQEVPASGSLGLALRRAPGAGAEILRVDAGSAAERAGLAAGDVITVIGRAAAPTPAQVRAAFASAPEGEPVMVAFTRGDTPGVTTIRR